MSVRPCRKDILEISSEKIPSYSRDLERFISAATENKYDHVRRILSSSNVNPNLVINRESFLLLLLRRKQFRIVSMIFELGADPNMSWVQNNGQKTSMIHLAVEENDLKAVSLLIDFNVDTNARAQFEVTPLMIAASLGHEDMTKLLVQSGADKDLKCEAGHSALDYARSGRNEECIRIIESGAEFSRNSESSQAPVAPQQSYSIVGQDRAKRDLEKILAVATLNKSRVRQGLKSIPISFHSIFVGSPGTGKTTFARYYAAEVRKLGILKSAHLVEVSRTDLVGGYAGQTAIKTTEIFQKARGGILFIDEAYSLKNGDDDSFGQESINTLLKLMEDHREETIVILAGYEREMSEFLDANPGLKSRLPNVVRFCDFSDSELAVILDTMFAENGLKLTENARKFGIDLLLQKKREKNFGNAREIRNLFEKAVSAQAIRLTGWDKIKQTGALTEIILSDLDDSTEQGIDVPPVSESTDALGALSSLVGLREVKSEITDIANFVRVSKLRNPGLSLRDLSLHMVFAGNPGTGKTTVARLMAKMLKHVGVLPTDNVVEADRASLVAEYLGQTASKTKEVFEKAVGGVLFIDEAYTLSRAARDQDPYGREAIDTLLKLMEDRRADTVVILAGYRNEMDEFMNTNPGLLSRFSRTILFSDYSQLELGEILDNYLSADGLKIDADARAKFLERLDLERSSSAWFGNARSVRKKYERTLMRQASRVARDLGRSEGNESDDMIRRLTILDVSADDEIHNSRIA